MDREPWDKKFRLLTVSLIFSGALNIGLIAALAVLFVDDQKLAVSGCPPLSEQKEVLTNEKIAALYEKASFRELVSLLSDQELVEDGYRKRDLALGCLVSFHDFHLEKALGGAALQRRRVKNSALQLFPGLSDDQFLAILRFAHTERWPFSARGLFALLKQVPRDPSLVQAFSVTNQFQAVQSLFPKSSPEVLIEFLCTGEWSSLERYLQEQSNFFDLSDERKRAFLALYPPSDLLLQMDFSYALKKLEDSHLIALLERATHSELLRVFCRDLLRSPRSDAVWKKSAEVLYAMAHEQMPSPFSHEVAIKRFFPEEQTPLLRKEEREEPIFPSKIHLVKEGESLWKIARMHHVTVEELVAINRLEGSVLRTGMSLKVPDRTLRHETGGSGAAAAR